MKKVLVILWLLCASAWGEVVELRLLDPARACTTLKQLLPSLVVREVADRPKCIELLGDPGEVGQAKELLKVLDSKIDLQIEVGLTRAFEAPITWQSPLPSGLRVGRFTSQRTHDPFRQRDPIRHCTMPQVYASPTHLHLGLTEVGANVTTQLSPANGSGEMDCRFDVDFWLNRWRCSFSGNAPVKMGEVLVVEGFVSEREIRQQVGALPKLHYLPIMNELFRDPVLGPIWMTIRPSPLLVF